MIVEDFRKIIHILLCIHLKGCQLGLQIVEAVGVGFFTQDGGLVIGLEGTPGCASASLTKSRTSVSRLAGAGAVQPAERLDCLNAIQTLIHIHGVQQRLIEAGLELVGDHQDAVIGGLEGIGDADLGTQWLRLFSVYSAPLSGSLTVAGKGHQRLDRAGPFRP